MASGSMHSQQTAGPPRKAHLLFVDLVGSSQMQSSEAVVNAVSNLCLALQESLPRRGKKPEVKMTGDGAFVVFFGNAAEPLKVARGIANRLRETDTGLHLRMALHSGEVVPIGVAGQPEYVGPDVLTCARLLTFAAPDQTLASASFVDGLRSFNGFSGAVLRPLGIRATKHGENVEVWEIQLGPAKKGSQGARSVFVGMPYSEEALDIYSVSLQPAISDLGWTSLRADEIANAGESMFEKLQGALRAADAVVAVLWPNSANVLFEAGFALGLGKPVLILTKQGETLPADISGRAVAVPTWDRRALGSVLGPFLRGIPSHEEEERK